MKLLQFAAFASVLSAVSADDAQVPLSEDMGALPPMAEIPLIGFGTWNLDRSNASDVVAAAIHAGYRHIDCAAIYGNEKEVGEGIKRGMKAEGIKREEIWVTSKLWNNKHNPKDVPSAINKTLTDLQLTYLDLYHMHWPVASSNGENSISYLPTWTAMTLLTKLVPSPGNPTPRHPLVRHIGVSNFNPSQIKAVSKIHKPYAHQFETHPYLPQTAFLQEHKKHGIHVTAYSPLGNANPIYTSWRKQVSAGAVPPLLKNPIITSIAEKRGCTPAQVALRWGIGRGTSVIPKSAHKERIEENWESLGCNLDEEDWETLAFSLPVKRFNNPSKGWNVPLYEGLEDADADGILGKVSNFVTNVRGEMVGLMKWAGLGQRMEL